MKRILASALILSVVCLGVPSASFAAAKQVQPQNGQVSGMARNQAGQPVANQAIRLRNTATNQVVANGTTGNDGAYSFGSLPKGSYIVELVDNAGQVIATSASITVGNASMTITGVVLTVNAAAPAGTAAAAAGGGSFFTSTAGIVLLGAGAAGAVGGVVAYKDKDKKPKSPKG